MKIQIDRETLLTPLQTVMGVVGVKSNLPILSNVLLDIQKQKLTVTGTDTEVELMGECISPIADTETRITLPGKKLMDIIRALPQAAPVELYYVDNKVTLTSGKSRFTLATLPATDFPEFKRVDTQFTLKIPQNKFRTLLLKTQFAIAQQDVRYYLNGLLLEINPDHMKAVATDGHRLAYASEEMATRCDNRLQIIIPRKAVIELIRLLEDKEEEIAIELGHHFINIAGRGFYFTSKLVEGRFPDYNRVVPKNNKTKILINRPFLQEALHRVAIVSGISARLEFNQNVLHVFANNIKIEDNAEDEVSIAYQDEPFSIAFNIQYLSDALANFSTEEIEMHCDGPDASTLLTEPGNDRIQYVIMPLRL